MVIIFSWCLCSWIKVIKRIMVLLVIILVMRMQKIPQKIIFFQKLKAMN